MRVIVKGTTSDQVNQSEIDGLGGCPDWEGCPHDEDNCWNEPT